MCAASHLDGCLVGKIPGAVLWCVRPSDHVHEPKHSVIAFSSTHEQLRAAGESDSVSIEKHHVFKRKCSREGAKGQLGFLRSQWLPSLQTPTLSGCRPILGHPVAWERGLR